VDFATQVLASMLKMRDSLGVDGYEREWRHPFPIEACEKLHKAVRKSEERYLDWRKIAITVRRAKPA